MYRKPSPVSEGGGRHWNRGTAASQPDAPPRTGPPLAHLPPHATETNGISWNPAVWRVDGIAAMDHRDIGFDRRSGVQTEMGLIPQEDAVALKILAAKGIPLWIALIRKANRRPRRRGNPFIVMA